MGARDSFFFGGCLEALGSALLDLGLDREAGLDLAGEGRISAESAGISTTSGRPEWGPRKLRIEEKCSQS